jgi:hypothetical protein
MFAGESVRIKHVTGPLLLSILSGSFLQEREMLTTRAKTSGEANGSPPTT